MKLKTILTLVAISVAASVNAETKITEKSYSLPSCATPVASVMVGKFACKSRSCGQVGKNDPTGLLALAAMANGDGTVRTNFAGAGEGMTDMLTTTLKATGCFDIQEREALEEMAKELALVGKKVDIQQADFMISGAITSIDMTKETKALGGGFIPIIGLISTTKVVADLGMDVKIIDVNRAKVLEAKTFQANNETTDYNIGGAGLAFGGVLAGGLSSAKNTPMEPIIRDILAQVATFTTTRLVALKAQPKATTAAPIIAPPAVQPVQPVAMAPLPPASAPADKQ